MSSKMFISFFLQSKRNEGKQGFSSQSGLQWDPKGSMQSQPRNKSLIYQNHQSFSKNKYHFFTTNARLHAWRRQKIPSRTCKKKLKQRCWAILKLEFSALPYLFDLEYTDERTNHVWHFQHDYLKGEVADAHRIASARRAFEVVWICVCTYFFY